MNELIKEKLLAHAIEAYEIGFLLLDETLTVLMGNRYMERWLGYSISDVIGINVTEVIPELVGVEGLLSQMVGHDNPFRLEEIYRPSTDGEGIYFDLQVIRLNQKSEHLLLTAADATRKARQELLLQQQRNEVQLLSAELTSANEKLSYILNRLVPPTVARKMMQEREMPAPGSEMLREATILFADMRDFTVYAEVYQPADTLDFLNSYLAVVSEAILRHDGSLVQLVGDMVMGVFNIPEPQPDHPERAVRAALDIQSSLDDFNRRSDMRFPFVSFGIGIATGPVVAGYLGVQQRFRYAVVGDATNVAFHLSSLAAPGRILLSDSTVQAAGGQLEVQEKGDFQLKRRRKLVKVYELSNTYPIR